MVLSGAARPPMPQQPDQEKKDIAEIGEKAPLFDLKDQQGNAHALTDFEGKVVVLEWFNEKCPYCKGVWDSGLVPKLINDLKKSETDVVYLAINSTANQPEEKVLKSGAEFLEENGNQYSNVDGLQRKSWSCIRCSNDTAHVCDRCRRRACLFGRTER